MPYGSVQDQEKATSDEACRSGKAIDGLCVSTPELQTDSKIKCNSVQDTCVYKYNTSTETKSFTEPCKCGLNPNGDSYCPKVYTPRHTSLLSEIASSLSVSKHHRCHTEDRLNIYSCLILNADSAQD
jgi:hypothetical protein